MCSKIIVDLPSIDKLLVVKQGSLGFEILASKTEELKILSLTNDMMRPQYWTTELKGAPSSGSLQIDHLHS